MIRRNFRCSICGTIYEAVRSGGGYDSHRDERYCPDCFAQINGLIKKIERRYCSQRVRLEEIGVIVPSLLKRFGNSSLPKKEDLLRWEAERVERDSREGKLVVQRIWPGLMDTSTGDSQNIRQIFGQEAPFMRIPFILTTWKIRPDYEIHIEIEWDIKANAATGRVWNEFF